MSLIAPAKHPVFSPSEQLQFSICHPPVQNLCARPSGKWAESESAGRGTEDMGEKGNQ